MIALACDHGGFELMGAVKSYLDANGHAYKDFGTYSTESCDYPDLAILASPAVTSGECDRGIFICGTGVGMSMTANKIPGIRAALCTDCYMAEMTRKHNDANVLVLGGRVTGSGHAQKIVEVFLSTAFESGGRHSHRVSLINSLDKPKTQQQ